MYCSNVFALTCSNIDLFKWFALNCFIVSESQLGDVRGRCLEDALPLADGGSVGLGVLRHLGLVPLGKGIHEGRVLEAGEAGNLKGLGKVGVDLGVVGAGSADCGVKVLEGEMGVLGKELFFGGLGEVVFPRGRRAGVVVEVRRGKITSAQRDSLRNCRHLKKMLNERRTLPSRQEKRMMLRKMLRKTDDAQKNAQKNG